MGDILATLMLCGLMGPMGQGVRAAIGLKSAAALADGKPGQQAEFNAAYFGVSLMIGFIAGIVAGLLIGLDKVALIDGSDTKLLLGIAAAGYAGADFIENSFSKIMPGVADKSGGHAVAPPGEDGKTAASLQGLTTQMGALASSVAALTKPAPAASATLPNLGAALRSAAPHVGVDVWLPALTAAFEKFEMTSNKRAAAALGQFLIEARDDFKELKENLTYTTASHLASVFPKEFADAAAAEPYLRNPEALGNFVYANRLGNGSVESGDGFRFRGRGLIQLTGRDEYTEFGTVMNMTPEEVSRYCETPVGATMSGCWYLASRGCLALADVWAISQITRRVNGNAMLENSRRIAFSNAILKAMGG